MHLEIYTLLVFFLYSQSGNSQPSVSQVISSLQYADKLLHEVIEYTAKINDLHPGPIDCMQIQNSGNKVSGVYRIWPLNWKTIGSFLVYCDMETDGGGWTVIQRRGNYKQPTDYFFKGWEDYSIGFGKLNEDFWLGNERIFAVTNQGNYSLRIDMKNLENNHRFAIYRNFWIENGQHKYKLHVSDFTGDAGDSFSDLNEMKFTTKDNDNDMWENNCAETYKGGWWYRKCHRSNLNGLYLNGYHNTFADGIEWHSWKGYNYSLPEVNMKLRRLNVLL